AQRYRFNRRIMTKTDRLAQLFTYLEQNPNDSFLLYCVALENIKLHNYQEALTYFNQIINNEPDYIATYYHLGKLYERLDNTQKAIETYETGLAIAQKLNDRHAHAELAEAKNALINDFDVEFDD
ncbi:MAG: tetratricopeptide repeat protein, partial [Chitinophagales bacterium]